MTNGTRTLLVGVAALAACGTAAALADPVTVYSEARRLGDGFAQVYAELDGAGAPQVIGVSFDQGMLEGLPTMPTATTSSPSHCRRSWCSAESRPSTG